MPGLVGRNSDASSMSFQDDMITVTDRLPTPGEYRRVRHLDLSRPLPAITEDDLAKVLKGCPHLETVVLGGASRAVSDRILTILADTAINLLGLDIYGCKGVTDAGLNACMSKSLPLQSVRVNGVARLTDAAVEAVAKTCSRLTELELCDLPGLTNTAVRDIWLFSRKLRTLRLANDPLLSDHAFPAAPEDDPDSPEGRRRHSEPKRDKPLPRRPMTWAEDLLPPLILRHTADNLRVLDLTQCQITDEAVEGIVCHAPRLQTFILSGCAHLTDSALYSIAKLGDNLDVLMLAHVPNITDRGVVNVARSCTNLRCVDVSFCRNLTDMSVFELAALPGLRRLSLVRVQKLTDIGLYSLAEHASELERLHLSYCDRLSLDAMHLLLRKLQRLEYFAATGVPCMRRKGIQRFSETTPKNYAHDQAAAFCVFSGEGVRRLRQFLDKEEKRRREAEAQNVPFVMREDDGVSLY